MMSKNQSSINVNIDQVLSALPEEEQQKLLELLADSIDYESKNSKTHQQADSAAIRAYRQENPELSKNANKAKNIRKKERYKELYADVLTQLRAESEPIPMEPPQTFSEAERRIKQFGSKASWSDDDGIVGYISEDIIRWLDETDHGGDYYVAKALQIIENEEIEPYIATPSRFYWGEYGYYHRQSESSIQLDSASAIRSFIEEPSDWIDYFIENAFGDEFDIESDILSGYSNTPSGAAMLEVLDLVEVCTAELDDVQDHLINEAMSVIGGITDALTPEAVSTAMANNPHYAPILESEAKMEASIVDRIPENPIDAYPLARSMTRKFTLHVGPTNSGKTHDAMEALGRAGCGVYLAPLRLLAFEQYENLNSRGCACTLLTGEEHREEAGASHVASTIEMLDYSKASDVVVIDEAQMMSDDERGSRWTQAIIGAAAKEIHVCMAPEALPLVEELVEACGDSFEVVEHERYCPLEAEDKVFSFPSDVREGDALVVFSRRSVHAVASEVARKKKLGVSMIYGALPYDVRHREAERFASGETSVVVATDAIGMGMNLPVKRVVFLEQVKFDGHERRFLKAGEVKQIAGRAGRYGIHDAGTFASAQKPAKIRKLADGTVPKLKIAPLGFSNALLGVEGRLSDIMSKWAAMEVPEPFSKLPLEREIGLARELEHGLGERAADDDVKRLVYEFATLPFKDNVAELKSTWRQMFARELSGDSYPVDVQVGGKLPSAMDVLEAEYARLDLLYQYCRVFGYSEDADMVTVRRDEISAKMMDMLGRGNVFDARKCRECGRELPWNWPYPMCDPCHDRMYSRRWDDWY